MIGVFATELAGETFDTVQAEVKADEKRRLATGEDLEAADTPLVLGPFNSTALTEWLVDRVPHAAQAEYEEVWRTLEEFAGEQWVPAATQAVAGRRRRAAEEKAMPGADSENPIERLLASLATPALPTSETAATGGGGGGSAGSDEAGAAGTVTEEAQGREEGGGREEESLGEAFADLLTVAKEVAVQKVSSASSSSGGSGGGGGVGGVVNTVAPAPSVAQFFYGEDEATAADLAARRRCAEWSVEGGIGRISLTSLLFSFSLMKAASRQWDSYPETVADLEALTKLPPAAQPETQAALKS